MPSDILIGVSPASRSPSSSVQASEPSKTTSDALPELPVLGTRRQLAQAVLLGAFGLDMLLYTLVVPFLPGRAQHLGASPLGISALFASYAGTLLVATPPAGWFTDRFGPRRTLLLGLLALAVATLLFALAPGLPLLFVARGAQGLAGAMTWTAGLALVAELYDVEARPAVFARVLAATGVGTLIGPPLGGMLYTWGGFRAPFLIAAALVVVDGLGRVLVLPARRPRPAGAAAHLHYEPSFITALLATLAGAGLLALLEPTLPVLLRANFGLQPAAIGVIFGGLTIVFIALQPLAIFAVRRLGAEVTIAVGLVISAAALLLVAVSSSLFGSVLALANLAFGVCLIALPGLQLLALTGQPGQHRQTALGTSGNSAGTRYGAIFAAYNLAYAIGLFLGPLLAGVAISWLGIAHGLVLLSVAPTLLACVMLRWRSLTSQRT